MDILEQRCEILRKHNLESDFHNVIGSSSNWDRQLIFQKARKELDNTALLLQIFKSNSKPIFDLAPTKEEDIRRLGPDLPKIFRTIMNSIFGLKQKVCITIRMIPPQGQQNMPDSLITVKLR